MECPSVIDFYRYQNFRVSITSKLKNVGITICAVYVPWKPRQIFFSFEKNENKNKGWCIEQDSFSKIEEFLGTFLEKEKKVVADFIQERMSNDFIVNLLKDWVKKDPIILCFKDKWVNLGFDQSEKIRMIL